MVPASSKATQAIAGLKVNFMRNLISIAVAIITVPALLAAPIPEPPFWVRNGTILSDDTFWGVGRDPAGSISKANADAQRHIENIAKENLEALGREYESSGTSESGTARLLSDFAANCTRDSWVIDDHWSDPKDGSMFSVRRLERSSVLECVETQGGISSGLKQFLRSKLVDAGDGPHGEKSVQMSITIDSVDKRNISILSALAHWYLHRFYIKGTIHGDVIDKQGSPVALLKIRALSNSWSRNPTLHELMSPTRGGFPGDRTEFEAVTDANGNFELPFSGYVGIRNMFTVTLSDLVAFQVFRKKDGDIYAKYFYGYRRIPITSRKLPSDASP